MAVVQIYIEKFGREVLIDENHPLAVAARAAAVPVLSASESRALSDEHTATLSEDASLAAATVTTAPVADSDTTDESDVALVPGEPMVGAPDVFLPPAGDSPSVVIGTSRKKPKRKR